MKQPAESILLVVEKHQRGRYCAGQWKDIESLNRILGRLGPHFECIEFDSAEIEQLLQLCRARNPTDIIMYYSFMPEVLAELRHQLPNARLYVRTVNAEAFQHWQRSEIGLVPSYRNLRSVYGSMRLAWRDMRCRETSDALLGISDWDNRHYWRHLPGRAAVLDVPYSSPWPVLRSHVTPTEWVRRRKEIVCLAGGRDAIGRTMLEGFNCLADQLAPTSEFRDWVFSVSPGVLRSNEPDELSKPIVRMESLDEPWDLLCNVRALAVLTPLGFGCKTTIADALAAGCHILVHDKLARRLSPAVRKNCIAMRPDSRVDSAELLRKLSSEPAHGDVSRFLASKARGELAAVFGLKVEAGV